jgi:subtilase family serine protease
VGWLRPLLLFGLALGAFVAAASVQPRLEANELADLEVVAMSIADNGSVIYQVVNRGMGGTDRPFVVDIYVDGIRRDSVTHAPLPPLSMQTVQSNRARLTECTAGTVRLVLDPQNGVREASETNNERVARLAPPCSQPARSAQPGGTR